MSATSVVKARRRHPCASHEAYVGCHGIQPGEMYRRVVCFPSDGMGYKTPIVLKECKLCADYYGRWEQEDLYGVENML